jgi:hypothetical protein
MKQEISAPVFAAIVAVAVLVVGFILWRHYSAPPAMPPGMAAPSYHSGSVGQKMQMLEQTRASERQQEATSSAGSRR